MTETTRTVKHTELWSPELLSSQRIIVINIRVRKKLTKGLDALCAVG